MRNEVVPKFHIANLSTARLCEVFVLKEFETCFVIETTDDVVGEEMGLLYTQRLAKPVLWLKGG